ncbi:MAG: DUF87 domain-containing protein [Anaerolineae bacterium]|nr:DUF87 domain-containing protein [Anaerolineae bacterium]
MEAGKRLDRLVMYDARDLTTHAVCVGMTGSGKTGLCIDLLEEAAIDSVPAILIDPHGDLTNRLLAFPDLRPEDFAPWVNVDDARRKDMTIEEYARYIADTWRQGLDEWGMGPERVRLLKESAEVRIYTPGSEAGLPISILSSLKAPPLAWDKHEELLREQIQGTVSALLSLAGIEADPMRSREHILLSNIFEHFWRQGEDLDMARLITAVQSPPVQKLGVFDVETFFPEQDRFELAMSLNSIIAAPGFQTWVKGEPLDIPNFLHTPDGKPRHSIFYIAHLNDSERMFFTTLLLEKVVNWMRQQSGTTSLRALLYIDEAFGFIPPVANPPSKRPLLTLLKQARAFGLGVMLTTQNPADLDYKGLTNAGTWFIGKLQTERDKNRLLDGLESVTGEVGGTFDRRELDRIISSLGSRTFLLNNVHEKRTIIFQTRWAMSYLRGPLTRSQVQQLMGEVRAEMAPVTAPSRPAVAAVVHETTAIAERLSEYSSTPPALPPDLRQVFLPLHASPKRALSRLEEELEQRLQAEETTLVYEPCLLALGRVNFVDRKRHVDESKDVSLLLQPGDLSDLIRWEDADPVDMSPRDLEREPESEALFGPVPPEINTPAKLKTLTKSFSDYLYREQTLELYYNPTLKLYSQPGESERDFKVRAQQVAREKRDAEVDKLRRKYQRQLDRLETRLAREEQELSEDRAEYEARKREELLTAGESLIGLLGIGRRRRTSALSRAATKRRLTTSAKADIEESEAEIARLQKEIEDMRQEMEEEIEAITEKWLAALEEIETRDIKPRRSDVQVDLVALAWAPYWEIGYRSAQGDLTHDRVPAWQ